MKTYLKIVTKMGKEFIVHYKNFIDEDLIKKSTIADVISSFNSSTLSLCNENIVIFITKQGYIENTVTLKVSEISYIVWGVNSNGN